MSNKAEIADEQTLFVDGPKNIILKSEQLIHLE